MSLAGREAVIAKAKALLADDDAAAASHCLEVALAKDAAWGRGHLLLGQAQACPKCLRFERSE